MKKPNLNVIRNEIPVKYDGSLPISVGKSRFDRAWKNQQWTWSALLGRLSGSILTPETHAEYLKMPKDRQDQIKDIGGFVGGYLKEGHRRSDSVICRQLLTLDLDHAVPETFIQDLENNLDLICAWAVYTTHKHTPKTPRFRLIIPLTREVKPDEYEAIARKVAEKVGIDMFDDTTYQASRLMYWPSHSSDVEPVFAYQDEPWLNANQILNEYPDWMDVSYWPESSRMTGIRKKQAKEQGDPLIKQGPVGIFCRTYSIQDAISTFLPEIYIPTGKENRYTYAAGSTTAGLVVYEDKFAYSNHGTDPAGGQLCNAFDLVRIHKFRDLDENSTETGASRPSYRAMVEFCATDPAYCRTDIEERHEKAALDFTDPLPEEDWTLRLRRNKAGGLAPDAVNAELIMTYDPQLQGIRYNELSRSINAVSTPWTRPSEAWRDADEAQLYQWIAKNYGVQFPDVRFRGALKAVVDNRRYHPVREYLESLPPWDGVPRVDTLLIDYIGAEDNVYTREATRKTLLAAVTRIFCPGAKFDCVLVLQGPQGIGKSTLFNRLGGQWFSDALSIADMRDKTAAERLQGYWIIEISEMTGMRKIEVEAIKSFISRQDDVYRAAYGRNTESHRRQCILVGSTNEETGFLRDTTGNRRFWPVPVSGDALMDPWDLTDDDIRQIWAEVLVAYQSGENLLLSREAAEGAVRAQREAIETDERLGIVEEYLDRLLPEDWKQLSPSERLDFLSGTEDGTILRTEVSNIEIWVEALHNNIRDLNNASSRAITAMMEQIPGWERQKRLVYTAYGRQRVYKRISR